MYLVLDNGVVLYEGVPYLIELTSPLLDYDNT